MRLGKRRIWCSDVVREAQEGLIRLGFEESRSESGREWLVHRPVGARERARSTGRLKPQRTGCRIGRRCRKRPQAGLLLAVRLPQTDYLKHSLLLADAA